MKIIKTLVHVFVGLNLNFKGGFAWECGLQSKGKGNGQELIQPNPHSTLKNERSTHIHNGKRSRKNINSKPNEQLFHRQVVIQLP